VKWAIGPFEPSQPATSFNSPIKLKKPADTIRIVTLGASGTEGWLSAETVFNKYGQNWEPQSLSSYSRAIEFSLNTISDSPEQKIEVINLGVAAYNISDVIRMLKDSLKLDPDLLIIQVGGNETWTEGRTKWSSFLDDDAAYLYAELGHEIFAETKAGWQTLATGNDAFNPLALFAGGRQPIVIEPPGRSAGLEPRLQGYEDEFRRLAVFLKDKQIPVLFLVPTQNIADYQPFGSMAKPGTSEQQLAELNSLLISALDVSGPNAKDQLLKILSIDDGIAEANFQLGRIYLEEGNIDKARELFWKANDRDLVLKRLPGSFHDISRALLQEYELPYLDVMKLYESKSANGVVGYNWLDDDVHPSRSTQFDLGTEIVKVIVETDLLGTERYLGDLQRLPSFADYNDWTGFDRQAEGTLAYLKGAHNFLTFGRFRQRMQWDPQPEVFLDPIILDLDIANEYAPSDQSLSLSAVLNLYLGRQDNAARIIGGMNCDASPERATQVHVKMTNTYKTIFGQRRSALRSDLQSLLNENGCDQ